MQVVVGFNVEDIELSDLQGFPCLASSSKRDIDTSARSLAEMYGSDIVLLFDIQQTGLSVELAFNTGLFIRATAERMVSHWFAIIEQSITLNPLLVSDIEIVTANEQARFEAWNATETNFDQCLCIHTLFEAQAEARAQSLALVFEDEWLSYRELNQRANRLAHYLISRGVGPDTLVGLCVDRSVEMVVAILAVLKAGGAYVPLDPAAPKARLAYQVRDGNLPLLITQERLAIDLPLAEQQLICLDSFSQTEQFDAYSAHNPDLQQQNLKSNHLAYMIYTSGSTGQPKGVMVEHRALVNRISWMQSEYGLSTDDKIIQKTPYTFDVSVWEFLWPLSQGSQLVVAKPDGHKDSRYLRTLIAEQKISVMHFVPSMLRAMLMGEGLKNLPSLRYIFCSGEALTRDLQDQFFKHAGDCALHNLYGPTEAAIDVSFWACDPSTDCPFVPIGKPIHNIELWVVDEFLRLAPQGVAGELLIGGVGLARGYLNQAALTAEKFVDNAFTSDAKGEGYRRLYRTGDLVRYLPDGNLEYLGRIDHQVKLRGFRIELGEIEAHLLEHPSLSDAAVVLDSDAIHDARLAAYVVVSDDEMDVAEELHRHLAIHLPEYMIPTAFAALPALPLTSSGKLDRKALPKVAYGDTPLPYMAPEGAVEKRLVELWRDLLKVERVGRIDGFLALGGNSLATTMLRHAFAMSLVSIYL